MPISPLPDPKRLAYDLWCIQEDRRIAGQPLENLDVLIRTLRERSPTLNEDVLQQGVEQFLAFMVVDQAQSFARRQRYFFRSIWGRPPPDPRPFAKDAGEPGSTRARPSARVENCSGPGDGAGIGNAGGARSFAQTERSRYNGENNPTSAPGNRPHLDRPTTEV